MNMETSTVRDAVFHLLRSFGMRTIFGNPGSTELPMFRNFPDDFQYVLALQEAVAVAMADGFAQATRNAAVVNLHSAVGVGHGLGNLFTAFRNRAPVVVVAGQQARSILPYQPFLFAEQATEFPKPYVKWSCEPARAQDVPAAIARAYYVAMQPPCGPTFVSVPVDDWDQPCELLEPRQVSRTSRADPEMLRHVADALAHADRPVFIVGAEIARDEAWDEAIALAERHRAEVWVSPMSSRNSFPEDHPLFAGFLAADREQIVKTLAGSDLILALGAPAFTYHVEGFGDHIPAGAKLFQLTEDPNVAAVSPTGVSVVSTLKSALRDLLDISQVSERNVVHAKRGRQLLEPEPLTDAYLLQRLAQLRPADSIIVEEAPSSRGAMHDHLPILARDTFYTCASGGLGYALPACIGVALGRPGEKVIALLGDGSAMYAIQGLWTAGQLGLPISFIIVNNRRYEALVGFGRRFGMNQVVGTSLDGLDFVALAHGHGVAASRVTRADALDDAILETLRADGPTLLEVVVS